jgi:flagellar FliJ protein
MKQFKFPLQAVLDLRERVEQERKIAFAAAQNQIFFIEREIAELRTQRAEALDFPPTTPVEERQAAYRWIELLDGQIVRSEIERRRRVLEAEARRQELAQAATDKRAVEKLRERALDAYQAEALRQEQLQLDEIASSRFQFARAAAAG